MNFYIQQSININILRVNSIANSSVLQIGSAGNIRSQSTLMNTGGFTEPAPTSQQNGFVTSTIQAVPTQFQPPA